MRNRLIAVVALALVAAACGGTSEVADSQPRTTRPITTTLAPSIAPVEAGVEGQPAGMRLAAVQAAMENTVADPPARIEGLIEMVGTDPDIGAIDISIPFSSSVDPVTGDGHMSMDFSGMTDLLEVGDLPPEMADLFDRFEIRQIGDTAYLNFGLFNMMFGAETTWVSMPAEDGEGFAQEFSTGINPYDATTYLESLSESGGDVTVVGTETLRGVETTHYRVVFDVEALAELDPDAFAGVEGSGPFGVEELPMDIWIDDRNRIHRYFFEVDGSDVSDLTGEESFDYMKVQFDFSDYGGRVTVEPPPADEVTDISELGNFFGGDLSGFEA